MIATVLRLSGRSVRTDFHPYPRGWLTDARAKDSIMGAFEDVIGTMDATLKVNRLTVEARFGFPVSRESKYPAYQPLQRSASLLVNRLSWQTLSPFGCLLLRTTRLPRLDRQYCVADALLSDPLSAELVNGHHMRVSIWKNLKLYGGRGRKAWFYISFQDGGMQ